MKESIVNNVYYSTVNQIKSNVRRFIKEVNRRPYQVINRLLFSWKISNGRELMTGEKNSKLQQHLKRRKSDLCHQ